ncbi:MAG: DUF1232 domain-containing protein [Methyloprofundus sp.]|nr:DUF1232 domain-containing protein [Methyloprofundus sp.]
MKDFNYEEELNKRSKTATEEDLKKILDREEKVVKKAKKGSLAKFITDIQCMYNLLKDYWRGEYREISWGVIASIVATLGYVFSPVDLIPDIIPVVGLADDAAMVALTLKLIGDDLKKYRAFKNKKEEFNDQSSEGF